MGIKKLEDFINLRAFLIKKIRDFLNILESSQSYRFAFSEV